MTRPWAWAAELGVTRTGYRSLSPGAGLTGDWTRLAPDTDTRSSELTLSHPLLTRGTLIIDSCNEVSMASSGQWRGKDSCMPRHARLVIICPETPWTNRAKVWSAVRLDNHQVMFRSSKLKLWIVFLGLNLLFLSQRPQLTILQGRGRVASCRAASSQYLSRQQKHATG